MSGPLARLRFPVEASMGRRYPEPPHRYRNDFQRDRDRIIHARAFRRLEDKTQVFGSGNSDHFRNRLTHTIEVTQISRTVACALGLNEDFTEALALAHDIGHPPFGHAGEEELDRQMRRFGDRFDHNEHALRIVEQFESRYAGFPGLNLTFEVREGIVKHSRDFELGECPEFDDYLPGQRPPLEAQLIDLCDEIAYNTADLDDAYSAGLISIPNLREESPFFDVNWRHVMALFPAAPEHLLMREVERRLIERLVSGLIEGTIAGSGNAADAAAVRASPQRLAGFLPETADCCLQLKAFLRGHVYGSGQLVADRQESTARIGALFQYFLQHPESLPEGYRVAELTSTPHRVVCDYLAGMTDGYLNRTWAQFPG